MNIEEKVIQILKNNLFRPLTMESKEVNLTDKVNRDLGADSLDAIEIIMDLEDEFGIYIPDSEASRFIADDGTVSEMIEYVTNHVASNGS